MKEFKPRFQVAGPPPLRLTRKQMEERRHLQKFTDEGNSQVRYKFSGANFLLELNFLFQYSFLRAQ